jgi:diguanylate cyclase (GGDEF)-like protein
MKRILKIFGNSKTDSIEKRILLIITFITGIMCALIGTINIQLGLAPILIIFSYFCSVVMLTLYGLSLKAIRFEKYIWIMFFFLTFVTTPVLWILDAGSRGGYQYFVITYSIAIPILFASLKRKKFIYLFILTLGIVGTMTEIENLFPDLIQYSYQTRGDRLFDVFFSLSLASSGAIAMISNVLNRFREERRKNLETSEELRKTLKALERIATIDELTGLLNRRSAKKYLEEALDLFNRYEEPFSILLLDIDYFKKINDTYGHDMGDIVLIDLADCLKDTLRKNDRISRWGGEEFLVVLPKEESGTAMYVAERLRKKISELKINLLDKKISITVTIGVATIKKDLKVNDVFKKADLALYKGKHNGRNVVIMED